MRGWVVFEELFGVAVATGATASIGYTFASLIDTAFPARPEHQKGRAKGRLCFAGIAGGFGYGITISHLETWQARCLLISPPLLYITSNMAKDVILVTKQK